MSPGRFLLATLDGGGTVPPELGLAARLVARGHTVRVLADPTLQPAAAAAGCTFSSWRTAPHVASVDEQTALLKDMERRNVVGQFLFARDQFICGPARRFADDLVELVREHPVDAALVEAALAGALIGAEATGVPTAALMPNIYLRPAPGLPPFGTGWSPGRGPVGRARDAVAVATVRRLWATGLPALNDALAAYELPRIGDMFELLDRCTRVLVLSSSSFEFPAPDLPSNVRYVGPQLDDPHWATGNDWRPAGPGPLVLVALSSTYQSQIDVLRRIAHALGRLPVRAVLTTGPAVAPQELSAPPNVRVVRAAPHAQVLPEASAVITHAGHGSVLKALAAGVPVVCIPLGRDQRDNAARVVRIGAGVRLRKGASVRRIAGAVLTVLHDPAYASASRRFAALLSHEAAMHLNAVSEAEALLPHR